MTWRPPLSDLLLAGFFVVLMVVEGLTTGTRVDLGGEQLTSTPAYLAIGVPAMSALALRRRFPVVVSLVLLLANVVVNTEGKSSTILAVAIACYSVGAHARRATSILLPVTVFFGAWMATSAAIVPSDFAAGAVFLGVPWAAGRFVRSRDQEATEAIDRAELLEREQAALAAAAAAEERVRLARELHDVVSHSISVVAVQTQAVRRRLGPDHQREIDDLVAVETTAREAMAELRRLFGVLRSEDQGLALAPQPGLGELDGLVAKVRATGLEVIVDRQGEHVPLQPGVDLAAYRIVQEALTNALRHAGATRVRIRLDQGPTALDIAVEDDGRGLDGAGGGHGLTGIRERAELYGGSLKVGASPRGGVRVEARLPLGARA